MKIRHNKIPPGPWAKAVQLAGGVQALATYLGCAERTVRRWAHGEAFPSNTAQKAIDRLLSELGRGKRVR